MPEDPTADHPEKAANERFAFRNMAIYLALGSDDGVVKLWDLRKATSFFELDLCQAQSKLKLGAFTPSALTPVAHILLWRVHKLSQF
ncbi:hypothetical protein PsorP6_017396 [Peronosclerospora sorghi]|uniref:Uncharacterized protein n=1 Tax=Peronosclerospora sorghi TaxID=230839 RepID=A0ACC0WNA8_9STRA|nr:hypothetical protein PsorP6_017396 [Peronosclerospora sorghi]